VLSILASCGGDDEPIADTPEARGAQLAGVHGCTSCHGSEGQGGFGPPWQGLADSQVELADGRVVTADDEYLRRAIVDPGADQRAGYNVPMPEIALESQEVEDLIAYIRTFS
jgi:cytochrome c oxidase subunit II